jgi:hypothetical protein
MSNYDPNSDWVPPKPISASDELTTVETSYGPMEKWKARALSVGWFQRVINDAAVGRSDVGPPKTPVRDEDKPPPLASDMNQGSRPDDETPPAAKPSSIPQGVLDALEAKIADLAARMDRFEAAQHAAAVLDALETQIEREHPSATDDVAGVTMH